MKSSAYSRAHADSFSPDLFAQAKERYTIEDAWAMFGFKGAPAKSCRSPFREDTKPSFSIYEDGRKWKDHATEDGGDVIEFIKFALSGDYTDVREFLGERLGIDVIDGRMSATTKGLQKKSSKPEKKQIKFPGELIEGHEKTWSAFARRRGLSYPGVWTMVQLGLLRFVLIKGKKCFVVLDDERRVAEIRTISGDLFFNEHKAYPLKGVDKTWLLGSDLLRKRSNETSILLCEGATDFLTAFDLYVRYRKFDGGMKSWMPLALLGANCKQLAPECAQLIADRKIRIVPDADDAGEKMAAHWSAHFHACGCEVDRVHLDPGKDLTDVAKSLNPKELFS